MPEISFKIALNSVLIWNEVFPIDVWWRMRYQIPFLSKKHLKTSFTHQLFEYIEYKELKKANASRNSSPSLSTGFEGNSSVIEMSDEEIDEEFKKLGL